MSCKFCRLQDFELEEAGATFNGEDHGATDETIKATVFHAACDLCDDPELNEGVILCDRCRHLRLYHLMMCYSDDYDDYSGHSAIFRDRSVSFNFTPSSRRCDLCVFIAGHDIAGLWTSKSSKQVALHIYLNGTLRLLADGGSHTLCAIYRPKRSYQITPHIDWDWVQGWISRNDMRANSDRLALQSDLQDVRVIDVLQDCVVPLPPKVAFLALSYVWGSGSEIGFHCQRSNVELLEEPQSLLGITLPQTISDAMIACKELGQRYLWVDRLCIVQDDPSIATQLEQMAAIYFQAALTIVAAAGTGATYGLAGVSRPRSWTRPALKYNDELEIINEMPELAECLSYGTWRERGWTYQEEQASLALLYFTDRGLYHVSKTRQFQYCNAEGRTARSSPQASEHDFSLVTEYSRRKLTHVSDRLRAISGILQALYGNQTYCGMPFENFDIALLWRDEYEAGCQVIETGMFPTWSWLACPGVVGFPLHDVLYGLANWGQGTDAEQSKPTERQWNLIPRFPYPGIKSEEKFRPDQDTQLGAALAWLQGCVPAKTPSWLTIDCSRDDYVDRLARHWRGSNRKSWNRLFATHRKPHPFDSPDVRTLSKITRVISHTQRATFALDLATRCTAWWHIGQVARCNVIRTRTGKVAGFVEVDRRVQDPIYNANAVFIALSVTSDIESAPTFEDRDEKPPTISEIYGCPCSRAADPATVQEHDRECPDHPDFYFVEQRPQFIDDWSARQAFADEFELAYHHHLTSQGYRDHRGQMLHSQRCPPKLNVMMIGLKPGSEDEGQIYQRLGIGKIYLKRWVEAEPLFDTIVLE